MKKKIKNIYAGSSNIESQIMVLQNWKNVQLRYDIGSRTNFQCFIFIEDTIHFLSTYFMRPKTGAIC